MISATFSCTPSRFTNRMILGRPDHAINSCKDRHSLPGQLEVLCHGTAPNAAGETFAYVYPDDADADAIRLNASMLAGIIRSNRAFQGQTICLLICWAGYGKRSLAQQLADLLQVGVAAPTSEIDSDFFDPTPSGGQWLFFRPGSDLDH